jgi:hypothetical protein
MMSFILQKNNFIKMSRFTFFAIFFGSLSFSLQSQTLEFANSIGNSSTVKISCSDFDNQGNLIVGGYFNGSFDADPDSNTIFLLQASGNSTDAFLIKYNSQGQLVWAYAFGSAVGQDQITGLALDANGDIFCVGSHGFSFDASPDTAFIMLPYNNQIWNNLPDGFVIKLSAAGNYVWSFALGSRFNDAIFDLDVNALGGIIITGSLEDSLDFDPSLNQHFLAPSIGGFGDAYIASYDGNGAFLWVKKIGNPNTIENFLFVEIGITGDIYTGGTFTGDVDFNPSPTVGYTLNAEIPLRYFIAKYTSLGNFVWARKLFSTSGDSHLNGIAVDDADNLYLCGDFADTVDFNLSNSQVYNLISDGVLDAFVAKYSPGAGFLWAKKIGTQNGNEIFESVHINTQQELWLSGKFNQSIIDADPGTAVYAIYGQGNNDVIVLALDVNGNFSKAISIGGAGEEKNSLVKSDSTGMVWVCGNFSDTVDFDLSWQTHFLQANTQNHNFIARYNFNQLITAELDNAKHEVIKPNIFPNPNQGSFSLQLENENATQIKIFNLQGQLLQQETVPPKQNIYEVKMKDAKPGIYFVEVLDGNLLPERIKFILIN